MFPSRLREGPPYVWYTAFVCPNPKPEGFPVEGVPRRVKFWGRERSVGRLGVWGGSPCGGMGLGRCGRLGLPLGAWELCVAYAFVGEGLPGLSPSGGGRVGARRFVAP